MKNADKLKGLEFGIQMYGHGLVAGYKACADVAKANGNKKLADTLRALSRKRWASWCTSSSTRWCDERP